jgi:hypothetical protein
MGVYDEVYSRNASCALNLISTGFFSPTIKLLRLYMHEEDFSTLIQISKKGYWYKWIKVITKLPNSEQSYKGKVQTHNYINRQNQSTTGKLWKPIHAWWGVIEALYNKYVPVICSRSVTFYWYSYPAILFSPFGLFAKLLSYLDHSENIVNDSRSIMIYWFIVFNATFSNISAISWRSVLWGERAGRINELIFWCSFNIVIRTLGIY